MEPIKNCPFILNAFTLSGVENLRLTVAAESVSTIEAFIERHLRNSPEVTATRLNIVMSTFDAPLVPVSRLFCTKSCSRGCRTCEDYMKRCLGCPMGPDYKGEAFKN
jgi:hypothetical protein